MIKKFFSLEEQQTIGIFSMAEIITLSLAYMLVMVFLNGNQNDHIVVVMIIYCLVVYLIRNKFTSLAKCMLSCSSALFSVVTIVSNSGRYGAIAATYFLFLIISMAHYDKIQVILSSVSILVTNIAGFIFFTDAYLKIHNKTVWLFILFIYVMAAICAYMITYRTHNLFQKEQQLQLSELQLANLRQIEKKNEEHSKFIHDIHHYFSAIGNLANSTKASLVEVESVIQRVQNNVHEITLHVEENAQKLTSQNDYFDKVFKSMQDMTKLLNESVNQITLMGDAHSKQSEVIKNTVSINYDIVESIKDENEQFSTINQMAESNASDISQVTVQASEINDMVDEINKILE